MEEFCKRYDQNNGTPLFKTYQTLPFLQNKNEPLFFGELIKV